MSHQQPLLRGEAGAAAAPQKYVVEAVRQPSNLAIYCFYLSCGVIVAYCALAFALPAHVLVFAEAAHVATLHAVAFFFIALFLAVSARQVFGPDARALPAFFPVSPVLAQLPFFLVTVGNALLLPVLGLEAWLRAEMAGHFSVLLLVQLLSCAEAACALVGVAAVTYRLVQYMKVSALPGGAQPQGDVAVAAGSSAHNRRRSAALSREGSSSSAHNVHQRHTGVSAGGGDGAAAGLHQAQAAGSINNPHSIASSQQLADALEQVRALQQRDELLGARILELTAALAAKVDVAGESVAATALRCAREHAEQLQAEVSRLLARCSETEKRMSAFFASELQRAATDVGRFREAYKEETRRNEKLYKSLEAEKQACEKAESDIQELRALLSRAQGAGLLSSAAAAPGDAALSVAPHAQDPSGKQQCVSSGGVATPAAARAGAAGAAVTLAARASFGAPGGLHRTSSGSAYPSQSPSVYGSPSNAAAVGSSSRRLMALGAVPPPTGAVAVAPSPAGAASRLPVGPPRTAGGGDGGTLPPPLSSSLPSSAPVALLSVPRAGSSSVLASAAAAAVATNDEH